MLRIQTLPSLWLKSKPVSFPSSNIEALKWIAMICMVIDHVDKIFFEEKFLLLGAVGRIAFPIFGFVLAYNLARPAALENGLYQRTVKRLALFALIATPFYVLSFKTVYMWWPLNVLFLLLAFVGIVWILELKKNYRIFALALFIISGALVEFWWAGLIYCLAAWLFCKKKNVLTLILWCGSLLLLSAMNGNAWALFAFPIICVSHFIDIKLPRFQYLFYVFYPAHLAILSACKHIFMH